MDNAQNYGTFGSHYLQLIINAEEVCNHYFNFRKIADFSPKFLKMTQNNISLKRLSEHITSILPYAFPPYETMMKYKNVQN
jgi:hypothetical protein